MAVLQNDNGFKAADVLPVFFVLVVGVIFGGSMVFLTPPFNAPDELGHWRRSYHCSLGQVYASRKGDMVGCELPTLLSEIYVTTVSPAQTDAELRISAEKLRKALAIPLDPARVQFFPFVPMARYSPVPYLPAAAAIAMGRQAGLGPLNLFYLGRAGTLTGYLLLVAAAVWLMPVHRWTLVLLALMPMSIFLAASLSPDALSIALLFLGIAMILRLVLRPQKAGRGSLWLLLGVLVLVGLAKPGYVAISLLCMLIPKEKFSDPRQGWWIRGLLVGLPLAVSVAWIVSLPGLFSVPVRPSADMKAQAQWMLEHPWTYTQLMMEKITEWKLYSRVIATLGWNSVFFKGVYYTIYWAALLASAVLDGGRDDLRLPIGTRIASVAVYFLIMIAIATLTYLTWHDVGTLELSGIQSRYFVPILPLLLLPLRGPAGWASSRFSRLLVPAMAIVAVLIGVGATWRTMVACFYWP